MNASASLWLPADPAAAYDAAYLVQPATALPVDQDWLCESERRVLAGLRIAPRRSDWLLGRWTAKLLVAAQLERLGTTLMLDEIEIRAAADGVPEVLVEGTAIGLSLSLSHRAGLGVAALAPAPLAIGCDLECIEPRSEAFVEDFLTAAERAWVRAGAGVESELRTALAWSAKESALKALRAGLRMDTRSIEVMPIEGLHSGQWRPLRVRSVDTERPMYGWWRLSDAMVLTLVTEDRTGAPTSALTDATWPSHPRSPWVET